MTVKELIEALCLKAFYVEEEDREIEGVYCGDLLSWVMGKCPADAAWITIMSNQNVAAVAVLCDTACTAGRRAAGAGGKTGRYAAGQ